MNDKDLIVVRDFLIVLVNLRIIGMDEFFECLVGLDMEYGDREWDSLICMYRAFVAL